MLILDIFEAHYCQVGIGNHLSRFHPEIDQLLDVISKCRIEFDRQWIEWNIRLDLTDSSHDDSFTFDLFFVFYVVIFPPSWRVVKIFIVRR